MPRPAGSCLVMLSGGLDSAVLLYDLLDQGERPVALTRVTKKREVQAAEEIAGLTGVPHIVLDSKKQVVGFLEAARYDRMDLKEHLGPNNFPHICSLSDSLAMNRPLTEPLPALEALPPGVVPDDGVEIE